MIGVASVNDKMHGALCPQVSPVKRVGAPQPAAVGGLADGEHLQDEASMGGSPTAPESRSGSEAERSNLPKEPSTVAPPPPPPPVAAKPKLFDTVADAATKRERVEKAKAAAQLKAKQKAEAAQLAKEETERVERLKEAETQAAIEEAKAAADTAKLEQTWLKEQLAEAERAREKAEAEAETLKLVRGLTAAEEAKTTADKVAALALQAKGTRPLRKKPAAPKRGVSLAPRKKVKPPPPKRRGSLAPTTRPVDGGAAGGSPQPGRAKPPAPKRGASLRPKSVAAAPAPAPASAPALAPGWAEHFTPDRKPYYSNGAETTWERSTVSAGNFKCQPTMRPDSFVLHPLRSAVVHGSTRPVTAAEQLPALVAEVLDSEGETMDFI